MTAPDVLTGPAEHPTVEWAPRWHARLLELAAGDTPTAAAATAVLLLHAPVRTYPKLASEDHHCPGDDFGGYDGEAPDWPCRTVQDIAAAFGVALHARCPVCSPLSATKPVWTDGRLVTHIAYRLADGRQPCPYSLTAGLAPGQEGP
jgi:hypothetical protein